MACVLSSYSCPALESSGNPLAVEPNRDQLDTLLSILERNVFPHESTSLPSPLASPRAAHDKRSAGRGSLQITRRRSDAMREYIATLAMRCAHVAQAGALLFMLVTVQMVQLTACGVVSSLRATLHTARMLCAGAGYARRQLALAHAKKLKDKDAALSVINVNQKALPFFSIRFRFSATAALAAAPGQPISPVAPRQKIFRLGAWEDEDDEVEDNAYYYY